MMKDKEYKTLTEDDITIPADFDKYAMLRDNFCNFVNPLTEAENTILSKENERIKKKLVDAEIAINKLKGKADVLEGTIDYLIKQNNRPWYIKLWSKIPKISIKITRR